MFKLTAQCDQDSESRIYHRQNGTRLAQTDDLVVLVDILTVCGTTLYTMAHCFLPPKNEDKENSDQSSSSSDPLYIADFQESELEPTGDSLPVAVTWLENQRQHLLL